MVVCSMFKTSKNFSTTTLLVLHISVLVVVLVVEPLTALPRYHDNLHNIVSFCFLEGNVGDARFAVHRDINK